MSKSSDPRNFFESDAQQAKRERRDAKSSNKYGNPVALKSKILAAIPDPRSSSPPAIFVAESAGSVRHVKLSDEPDIKTAYRGPSAPVTCVAVGGAGGGTLFAGSWDKSIWSWDLATGQQGRKYTGHTDFVKTVVCARLSSGSSSSRDVLISGGADKRIIVWDIATGKELHVLQDGVTKMLAVQHLAVDPARTTPDEIHLVSASSDPHIRRWRVREASWEQVVDEVPDPAAPGGSSVVAERRTLLEHETSVYRLAFVPDADGESLDLWTASGDGTAKCLSPQRGLAVVDSFDHGDHVKALAVVGGWVVTAGRNEDLKYWDRASGELQCALEGHYDEVTDLLVLADGRLCSVSIDGTVRTWPVLRAQLDALVTEQREAAEGKVKEPEAAAAPQEGMLSIEEEAELAALMDDD
ncbi:hypothetical protein RB595_004011 [Gaeumannomyces hyphopodioides]